jgi:gliding motility-associated-like protein
MNWMLGVGCSPPTDSMVHVNFNTGLQPIVQNRKQPQAYNCDYNATSGTNNWYYWTLPNTRTTTASDINGDVQFYVIANKVYDKNHNLMNGIGNVPSTWNNNWTGTFYKFLHFGGASEPMIIPRKDSIGKYYVYYIDINLDPNASLGNVRRICIDMNQNGGNGRITHVNEFHELFNVPYTYNNTTTTWWGSNKMDYLPTNCDSAFWAICYGSNSNYSAANFYDTAFYAVKINPYTGSITSTKTMKDFHLQQSNIYYWDQKGAESIRFSPWGNKLALVLTDTVKTMYYLADFNSQTGEVSNYVLLTSVLNSYNNYNGTVWNGYNSLNGLMDTRNGDWGGGWAGQQNENNKMLEFSADGNRLYGLVYGDSSKLYYTTASYPYLYATTKGDTLAQWDITGANPAAIVSSRTNIALSEPTKLRVTVNNTYYNGRHVFYELERAGDNKIYLLKSSGDTIRCNTYSEGFYRTAKNEFAVIHNPENLGLACNFQNNYIKYEDSFMVYHLPNKVPTTLTKYRITDSAVCGLDSTKIHVVPNYFIDSVSWNFGDPGSGTANTHTTMTNVGDHAFSAAGVYTVTAYVHRRCSIDTVTRQMTVHPHINADLGPDSMLCVNSIMLNVTNPGATYLWDNGLTAPTRNITTAGTFWVKVTQGNCVKTDTVNLAFFPPTNLKLGNDTTICSADMLTLNAAAPTGSTYVWSTGSTNSSIQVNQAGTYSVAVTNYCGVFRDTIKVNVIPTPVITLGPDTTLCHGDTMQLNVNFPNVTYQWSTGSTSNGIVINSAGNYWLRATSTNNNCIGRDTIKVDYLPNPNFSFGPDRTICEGDSVVLIMPLIINPSTYVWSDGDTTRENALKLAGTYYGTVTNRCGTQSDTISVNVNAKPVLSMPHDTTFCKFYPFYVHASNGGGNTKGYTWLRGEGRGDSVLVNHEGWYIVAAANDCGISTDSMVVYERYCCDIAVPNAFSPDGDAVNDVLKPIIECEINNYKFEVFSRWGQLMFSSTDFHLGWDGKMNGKVQDIGTYIWTVTYQVKGELTPTYKKGNVTLIR